MHGYGDQQCDQYEYIMRFVDASHQIGIGPPHHSGKRGCNQGQNKGYH